MEPGRDDSDAHAPASQSRGCTTTTYGYATATEDPGHTLFHTIAMTAFLNKREVQFLIAGPGSCSYGKPKIIAVKMY